MSEPADMRDSRTATIVDPDFMADPETMSLEEIRDRRDQARAELEFQSYLRRLIQVRQDILLAERKAPVEAGVVSVHSAGRFSSTTHFSPARAA